jgi:hypothetical protein
MVNARKQPEQQAVRTVAQDVRSIPTRDANLFAAATVGGYREAAMERIDGLAQVSGSAGEHELQRRNGTTERAERFYRQQVLDHLNDRMREFLGRQEMLFVATSDGGGACDCAFRAGPPGFVQALDRIDLPVVDPVPGRASER